MVGLGACGFTPNVVLSDAAPPIDTARDTQITATWSVDSTSMKGVPESAAKWNELDQAFHLTSAAPDHLWWMQEPSGNLVDFIGGVALGPVGTPSYINVVPGWTRLAVGTPDSAATQGFVSYSIGNLDGTSYALLAYVAVVSPPTGLRSLAGIGLGSDHRYAAITAAPTYDAAGAGMVSAHGTMSPAMDVHPVVIVIDATHSTYTLYTDKEKLSPTWKAPNGAGSLVILGNGVVGSALARYLYATMWVGPNAELGDAQIKQMLQALGWTVSGY